MFAYLNFMGADISLALNDNVCVFVQEITSRSRVPLEIHLFSCLATCDTRFLSDYLTHVDLKKTHTTV